LPGAGGPACSAGWVRPAARLKVISPGGYPDLNGPPYTRSSNTATPAQKTTTDPSHQPSARGGTLGASGFLRKDVPPNDLLSAIRAVGRMLGKLDLRDRVQAVVYAYEHGLVRPQSRPSSPPP
jgi:hypothetical protein